MGQVQRKVIERGEISVEDEIADSVFMKVSEVLIVIRTNYFRKNHHYLTGFVVMVNSHTYRSLWTM